ncbi:MAG: DMT family transporter [Vitreimonas sp.]
MTLQAPHLYLAGAIVLEVIGTAFLKQSNGFRETVPSVITAASYAGAFYLLSLTLKTMPVGTVYAIWSGVGIVLIALVGWIAFRQTLDAPALIGMALIVAGVVVINTMSRSTAH